MTEDDLLRVTKGTRWEKTIANMLEWSVDVDEVEQMLTVAQECLPLFAQCFDTHERKACGGLALTWAALDSTPDVIWTVNELQGEGMIYEVVDHEALDFVYVFSPIVREV